MKPGDHRDEEQIEGHAIHLYAIYIAEHEQRLPTKTRHLWACLKESQREGWRRLARSIRGVIHHEEATSGGFATAPQADTIRELRTRYLERFNSFVEHSYIGTTRPYGEMVVVFEWPGSRGIHRDSDFTRQGFLVHPDGSYEDLHRERVS